MKQEKHCLDWWNGELCTCFAEGYCTYIPYDRNRCLIYEAETVQQIGVEDDYNNRN